MYEEVRLEALTSEVKGAEAGLSKLRRSHDTFLLPTFPEEVEVDPVPLAPRPPP